MSGVIGHKSGFLIAYIFIFSFGAVITAGFIKTENIYDIKLDSAEDSVVANRVIKCFSEKDNFGILDEEKFSKDELTRCMGDKYGLDVNLRKLEGKSNAVEIGAIGEMRTVSRYVLADGKGAKLEVGYTKNVQ
ncbi:hypothetical protein HYV89_03210 [Candidatus Woesearchaeota archaeon]|nr:hypothetical protein [Candidatus Woesearchaeota archaeon]